MSGEVEISGYIEKYDSTLSNLPSFQKNSQKAQLYYAAGKYAESIPLFEDAFIALQDLKKDYVWEGLYYTTCGLFASALDYMGNTARAEEVYLEMMKFKPDGPYIGDYAVFLHRRKRDYTNSNK